MTRKRPRWPMLVLVAGLVLLCLAHQVANLVAVPQTTPQVGGVSTDIITLPQERLSASATSESDETPGTPSATGLAPSMRTEVPSTKRPIGPTVLTILYDSRAQNPRLRTAWGFACLIEAAGGTVLFDTGADGPTLLHNMGVLGIDPAQIERVVLSHNHADHTGGLAGLLEVNDHLTVYVPQSFAGQIESRVAGRAEVVAVSEPMAIVEGIWTLGELGSGVLEQSIYTETRRGLVVVTGCAHPGIVAIAKAANQRGTIALLLGGFHLRDKSEAEVDQIIRELQALGVQQVGPAHCTGDLALGRFRAAFGENFLSVGAGTRITLEP